MELVLCSTSWNPPKSNYEKTMKTHLASFNGSDTRANLTLVGIRQTFAALFLAIFWLLLSCGPVLAQGSPSNAEPLSEKINTLERDNQMLRSKMSLLSERQELLNEKTKDMKEELKQYEPFKYWAWVLAGLGGANILAVGFMVFGYIPRKTKGLIDTIITTILTDRREDFLGLLKEYDYEKAVKQRHQIVLLSHCDGSDGYYYSILEKNGFRVTPLTKLKQLEEAKFEPDDILVINNDSSHWSCDQVKAFIEKYPNRCFYIGKIQIDLKEDAKNRFAAANFKTQVVGNLMNLLKYVHH